jgi:hypothetical protein
MSSRSWLVRWQTVLVVVLMGLGPGTVAADGLPFGDPAYDSGWVDLTPGSAEMLTHDLGGDVDEYVVDVEGRSSSSGDRHAAFGSDRASETSISGFYWLSLTTSTISVYRAEDDGATDQARVRIWRVASAAYDSGWRSATSGTVDLTHGLGGDPDDYVVYMEMYGFAAGVNQVQYGRDRFRHSDGTVRRLGAFWYGLDASSIHVFRGEYSSHADEVRVRIWRRPEPAYDSGWVSIDRGESLTMDHGLGGPWNDFVVDLQLKDTNGSNGVNHRSYGVDRYWDSSGGAWVFYGAQWRELTGGSIEVWRAPNDNDADQVRVRIWSTSAPRYDSGWQSLSQSGGRVLVHQLGGDPDAYYVDLQLRDSIWGVNHWNYGGDQVWLGGGLVRTGAEWSHLTGSQIYVYRYSDDTTAEEVRVRIWMAPFADYSSGWRSITPGSTEPLSQDVGTGGVVGLDFKDTSSTGINARFSGGDRYRSDGVNVREMGAQWRAVDSSHITIYRGLDDTVADEARVRIWEPPEADYDSGWTSMGLDEYRNFNHAVGGRTDDLLVDLQCSRLGWINAIAYGGDTYTDGSTYAEGAYWRALTPSAVQIHREENDLEASSVRVRVWQVDGGTIFSDGFESGDVSAWSAALP